jgi:hypothetical protein
VDSEEHSSQRISARGPLWRDLVREILERLEPIFGALLGRRLERIAGHRLERRLGLAKELRVARQDVAQIGIHRCFGERVEVAPRPKALRKHEQSVRHIARAEPQQRIQSTRKRREKRSLENRRRVVFEVAENGKDRAPPERTEALGARPPGRLLREIAVDEM